MRDPFPGNVIPVNRFSPVASKILELAPIEDPLFPGHAAQQPALALGQPGISGDDADGKGRSCDQQRAPAQRAV